MRNRRSYAIFLLLGSLSPLVAPVQAMESAVERRPLTAPRPVSREAALLRRISLPEMTAAIRRLEEARHVLKQRILQSPDQELSATKDEIHRKFSQWKKDQEKLIVKLRAFLTEVQELQAFDEATIQRLQQKLQMLYDQLGEYPETVIAQWEAERQSGTSPQATRPGRRPMQRPVLGLTSRLQEEWKPYRIDPAATERVQFNTLLLREAQKELYRGLLVFERTLAEMVPGGSLTLPAAERARITNNLQPLLTLAFFPTSDPAPEFMHALAQLKRMVWKNIFSSLYHSEHPALASFMKQHFEPLDQDQKTFYLRPEHAERFFALWDKHSQEAGEPVVRDVQAQGLLQQEYERAKESWLQATDDFARSSAARFYNLMFLYQALPGLEIKPHQEQRLRQMILHLRSWNASPFLVPQAKAALRNLWQRAPEERLQAFPLLATRFESLEEQFSAAGRLKSDAPAGIVGVAAGRGGQEEDLVEDETALGSSSTRERADREREERQQREQQEVQRRENIRDGAPRWGGGE